MWSNKREIEAGDTVILWLTRDNLLPLTISSESDAVFNSKFGSYPHSSLIGLPYGSKVPSRRGNGFIHVLRPTPELWTLALPHRTQILYAADIAFITGMLGIKKGSRVVEAGTGSGSFSHAVMRTVGSSGHLWSYEFHEARHSKARDEFTRHGFLPSRVTLTHRNVCKEGFTIEDTADALFLDIPAPWDAIDHAKRALKKDRITRICCFSPCMEQVMRTVSALNDAGFTEITMYETLLRPHEVSSAPPLVSINEIGEKIKQSEARREEKRLKQIAQGHRGGSGAGKKGKRKHEEDEVPIEGDPEAKRAKTEDADDEGPNGSTAVVMSEPKQEEDVEMTAIAPESATSTSAPTPQAQVENTSTTKQPSRPQRKRNMVGDPSAVTLSRVMPEEDDGDNGKESGPKPQSGASAADAEMTVAA